MVEEGFRTSEVCKLDRAFIEPWHGVAECVWALFDMPRGHSAFLRLEWLTGNRWAIWSEREDNEFDEEYEAVTVAQSRERIFVDDAGLLNREIVPLLHKKEMLRPKPYIPLGARAEMLKAAE